MSRSPLNPNQLRSVGSQDALASLPPPTPQNPSTHSWDPLCGSLPWGLSCLLALQHVLVVASLLCVSHLLLLYSLPPGRLSYSPSQLLASSFFSCGVSTILQTWVGSRLPLVQAPSLEFLIPALLLTSQKLPLAIQTPGNSSRMHLCRRPSCLDLGHWNTSIQEVSGAVVVSGLLQGTLGLLGSPGRVFLHCGPLVLAPSLVVAGLSAHREVAQFCSAHWGLALLVILLMVVCSQHLGSCQFHVCPWRRASTSSTHTPLPAFRLLSVLIPVACVWIISAFVGFSVIPQELSDPTKAPWIWLPHPGGVLGVTQAVVLSAGFSSFYLADIDSGRNIFIVGFSIFMALLLPRWFRDAPILFSTGWSPLDVLLHSLLTQPIFLAGLSGFLLENTIPGTQLERGLSQGIPSSFTAQEARMPQKSREKAAQVYGLPFHIQNLCLCIPQPLHCLCPLPEDPGDEEGGSSEPEEMADLLPGLGEPCPESSREGFRSQK
ncbi:solute carrier family 23 member 3 isoform X1 [Cebus imitator]|uniref:solute carrier family 23 member 3 isoform X1 n=1 Tax=Cebus imitator TaxID=2715852 RepID=UPI00189760F1|nr:solute carrier family 23 member 3 isoform X1 [Cebus imitator]